MNQNINDIDTITIADNAFVFENDLFNRKPLADALTELIKNTPDEFVIAIDGKWGEGKTTFVKMWQSLLEDQKIPCIYFDAF